MQLFEIDRLLKHEANEAEKVISAEIANIEPQFDEESGEFKAFKSWSASTALLESFKIKEVEGPRLGQQVPAKVTGLLTLSLKDFPAPQRAKFVSDLE